MGTKYSSNSASGFDSVPPSDDGAVSESNKVKWSTIKTKLATPVKDLADAINTDLVTHFNHGPVELSSNTTLGTSHYEQFIQVSGSSVTLTLSDASALGAGWNCRIINTDSSNNVTLARATGSNTINGTASNFTLTAGHAIDVFVIAATTGFIVRSAVINPVTTDTTQTITGDKTHDNDLRVGTASSARTLHINGAAGQNRSLQWETAGSLRFWDILETTAESGSNAGSNRRFLRYSDGASQLGDWLQVRRSDGAVQAGNAPTGGFAGADIWNFKATPQVNNVPVLTGNGFALLVVQSQTASSSSLITFSSLSADTHYILRFSLTRTAASTIHVRVNGDATSGRHGNTVTGTNTSIEIEAVGSAADFITGSVEFVTRPADNTEVNLSINTITSLTNASTVVQRVAGGKYNGTALSSLDIFPASGNIDGVLTLYKMGITA